MQNFKDLASSVEYHGGDIFFDRDMTENEIREDKEKNANKTTPEGYQNRTIGKSKTVVFIKSAKKKKYGCLQTNIRDQQSFKIDVYPKTLVHAYEMLSSPPTIIPTKTIQTKRKSRPTVKALILRV